MFDRDEGPTSRMEEDLEVLGLNCLFEQGVPQSAPPKPPAAKPGVTPPAAPGAPADPAATDAPPVAPPPEPDADDQPPADPTADPAAAAGAAAPRTEVPTQAEQEDDGEEDEAEEKPAKKPVPPQFQKFGKKDDDAEKDDDEDEDEDEEDEGPEQTDESYMNAIGAALSLTEAEIHALDEDDLNLAYSFVASLKEMTQTPAKVEAAYDVLDAFYGQLAEDNGQSIDHDALVGVVEAMEAILLDLGIINECSSQIGKGIERAGIRALVKGSASAAADKPTKIKEIAVALHGKKSGKFKKAAAKKVAGIKLKAEQIEAHRGQVQVEAQTANPATTLVQNLAALKEAVTAPRAAEAQAAELIDGFRSVGETATTWYESIAEEVKSVVAEGKLEPGDPRVAMGQHLEGIANDAAKIVEKIEAGEVQLEDAQSDLQSIAADLNDAAEVMKQIE